MSGFEVVASFGWSKFLRCFPGGSGNVWSLRLAGFRASGLGFRGEFCHSGQP